MTDATTIERAFMHRRLWRQREAAQGMRRPKATSPIGPARPWALGQDALQGRGFGGLGPLRFPVSDTRCV
jgi:hypothetical protein